MADKKYNQSAKITDKDFLHTLAGLAMLGLSSLFGLIRPNQPTNFVSPLAEDQTMRTAPTPTPTPTLVTVGRNPRFQEFTSQNPKSYQEIVSAVNTAVPENDTLLKQLLLDLSLEESGLRTKKKNPRSDATGAWQFVEDTAKFADLPLEAREDATASAKAARKLLEKGYLHWWETYRKGGATGTPIRKLYSPEELRRFLK